MWVMTPGPLLVQQHVGLARGDAEVVPVAGFVEVAARLGLGIELLLAAAPDLADAHGRGGAHRAALLRFGEVVQQARLDWGKRSDHEREDKDAVHRLFKMRRAAEGEHRASNFERRISKLSRSVSQGTFSSRNRTSLSGDLVFAQVAGPMQSTDSRVPQLSVVGHSPPYHGAIRHNFHLAAVSNTWTI